MSIIHHHPLVDRISLAEYLKLLEVGSHYYRDEPIIRLYRQLEEGLRIHDAEGRKALYGGFENEAAWIDDRWPTFYADKTDELGRFFVRREDVAGYLLNLRPPRNLDFFEWRRRNGELVSLRTAEHVQKRFIGFQTALHILRRRFDKPGHEVTSAEIAIWLDRGFIRARTCRHSCAWEVDYSRWLDVQRRELAPATPSLEDCLQPLFFAADELERLDNPERYLSYAQLVDREKKRGLSEQAVIAALSGDGWFRQDFIPGHHPAPLGKDERDGLWGAITHPGSGPIRRFLPGFMYPLDVVEEWERGEAPPDHEQPEARESVVPPGSIPTLESSPQAAFEDHQNTQPARQESDLVFTKRGLIDAFAGSVKDGVNLESLFSNASKSGLSECKSSDGKGWYKGCVLRFLATKGYLKEEYMGKVGEINLDRFLSNGMQIPSKPRKS